MIVLTKEHTNEKRYVDIFEIKFGKRKKAKQKREEDVIK